MSIVTVNCFPSAVPENAWTVEPSGTALEAIGTAPNKNKLETSSTTEVASESPLLKSSTIKQLFVVKFETVTAKKLLEEGGKCVGGKVHVFGKSGVAGSALVKLINGLTGITGGELTWATTTTSEWRFGTLSNPGFIFTETIETFKVEYEHMKANAMRVFETYLKLEIEEASAASGMTMLV